MVRTPTRRRSQHSAQNCSSLYREFDRIQRCPPQWQAAIPRVRKNSATRGQEPGLTRFRRRAQRALQRMPGCGRVEREG